MTGQGVGVVVTHRRYVPHAHAHYGGGLVDGAYVLGLFGDVATEVCVRADGDEGLFAGYASVEFLAPVRAGDVIEAEGRVVRVGRRSRTLEFTARVVCRARPDLSPSAAAVLDPPVQVVRATGTVVVPGPGRTPRTPRTPGGAGVPVGAEDLSHPGGVGAWGAAGV